MPSTGLCRGEEWCSIGSLLFFMAYVVYRSVHTRHNRGVFYLLSARDSRRSRYGRALFFRSLDPAVCPCHAYGRLFASCNSI
jgi:hypothetical protein